MTPAECARIVGDRLPRWARRLEGDFATPLVLVAVRHAPDAVGQVVVLTVDEPEMTEVVLAAFLRKAAIMLDPTQRRAVP